MTCSASLNILRATVQHCGVQRGATVKRLHTATGNCGGDIGACIDLLVTAYMSSRCGSDLLVDFRSS